ncbi:MAG: hypothetical protein KatS3mg105_4562 [Gemmatales bacterium]|nr:MAG: hypothetical protein KatS3mg105_4562 [Gemmatales bacterium]
MLQLADGGTVFLDELADIPLPVQVKLLRVLEHNEVLPVGGNQPQPLNIRILSATHRDLSKCVAEGTFRHDLYYRLNVFQIHLPPLRERKDDIPLLAEQFLRRFAPQALPLAQTTVDYLKSLPWFGNVRELQNALEHAAIVARDQAISPEHFPPALAPSSENASGSALASSLRAWIAERIQKSAPEAPSNLYADLLREIEAVLFEDIIRRVEGNRWVAAQWLGLNRATVRKKLALYNLADIDRSHDEEDA